MTLAAGPREIATEFAFRPPQRQALTKLHATLGAIDLSDDLPDIQAAIPGQFGFDTDFPSFCFDLATGVGKTKLLAGCITYLARNGYSNSFLIIAPGETIYSKLIREFTPGSSQYLLSGIAGMTSPKVVSGEDYLYREAAEAMHRGITIYIFNIQKLLKGSAKQRYRFHTFQETLGASFAERLREKGDLVVLMDESHRYRGPEYFAAINDLRPKLGLEYTATPIHRGNVLIQYPLKTAIADGWVKRIRPIYRQNDASFDEELDELKLRDGLQIHETTKQELESYAHNSGLEPVRPLVLVNIELIERAKELKKHLEKDLGYAGRVLLIHSKSEDEEERQLVELEDEKSKVEIVVHVNKLREGWDVKNIFTIIPLRASISAILTAQTIGRGVRLPFGVNNREELADPSIATLNVVCYQKGRDNYARIIESSDQLGDIEPEDAAGAKQTEKVAVAVRKKASKIAVPEVDAAVTSSSKLKPFKPRVEISDEKAAARLVGVDILSGEKDDDLGEATTTTLTSQADHLAATVVEKVPELGPNDVGVVAKIVKGYLRAATKSRKPADWEEYLESKRRFARVDLIRQVRDNVQKASSVKYTVKGGKVQFDGFETVLPVGSKVRDRKGVPNDEVRRSLVGGYKKTVYEGFRFDSQQEKWLGDALDDDKGVVEWMKVPEGKLVIRTPAGRYLPDFIAVTRAATYLIEVKDSKSVEQRNPVVVEKARRAAEWCKELTAKTKKPWMYRLLRHDRIKQGDTLKGMLAGAVSLDDFIGKS